jgi:acetyl esterase
MMSLDPQAQALLDAAARSGLPPVYELPIPEARRRMRAAFISDFESPVQMKDVQTPGGITVRRYQDGDETDVPAVAYLHGGGWTVNDLDTHDRLCATLAELSECVVLSIDFRCAPETKYPGALADALATVNWIVANADRLGINPARLCLAGDSSGASLAIGLALLAKDGKAPALRQLVLFYPVTDYLEPETRSYRERGAGYSLDRKFMEWAWRNYLPDEWSPDDPYLFPLRADLQGLPPTVLLTAEFDPLRDEGIAFAQRLKAAGVDVDHRHAQDQMHGFAMQTHRIDRAAEAVRSVASGIKETMRPAERGRTGIA